MDLNIQIREKVGTSAANELRAKGYIPIEIYGRGFTNIHGGVLVKDFTKAFKITGETTVITLAFPNEKIPTLVYDVAHDPRTGIVTHVDFYRVRMDEKITAHVPIEYVGESQAVKGGGVLVKAVHEIEVETLPGDMPHTFTVDLSRITEIGGSVQVKDVLVEGKAPREGIIKVAGDMVIATVIAPRAEEVVPVAAPRMEDIKVETEEKKTEREKEKLVEEARKE